MSTAAPPPAPPSPARANAVAEEPPVLLAVKAYFGASHATAAASMAAASLVTAAMWPAAQPRWLLAGWWALIVAIAALRLCTGRAFNRAAAPRRRLTRWRRLAWGVPVAMGTAWGAGAGWMLGHADDAQAMVVICVSLGAVMGSITNAVYWPAHLGFFLPLLALLVTGLIVHPRPETPFLVAGVALLAVLMAAQGRALSRRLVEALCLGRDHQQLVLVLSERQVALEQANRELALLTRTDPLTGLMNRRGWSDEVERAGRLAQRERHGVGLLVVDIDHFKRYNDSHGHAEGDACLRAVAAVLRDTLRGGSDVVARLGGEEFGVLLPRVGAEELAATAERLRRAVAAMAPDERCGPRSPVTVSIGAAHAPAASPGALNALFDVADRALYEAKRGGRNRVCGAAPIAGETALP